VLWDTHGFAARVVVVVAVAACVSSWNGVARLQIAVTTAIDPLVLLEMIDDGDQVDPDEAPKNPHVPEQ
jgi:hypothetical protein